MEGKKDFEFAANRFVLDWIEPDKKMLDLACGNCMLLDYALSKGCDVKGVDIIPQRKTVKKHDLNKKLPFKNESFDIVSCIDSLEHVKNVGVAFKEAQRVLKPNGIFIVTVPNSKYYKNPGHVSYFTYRYMKQLIKLAGFKVEKERHYIELPFKNFKKRIVFPSFPGLCFHFVFKLRRTEDA